MAGRRRQTGFPLRPAAVFLVALVLTAAGVATWPPFAQAAEFRSGRDVDVTGEHEDMVFAAGGTVRVNAQVHDDIFASGGEVSVTDTSAGHLIAAGGQLTLSNTEVRDLIVAGGEIFVSGVTVADDTVLSGGRINLDANSSVGGTTVIAGGDVRLAGTLEGDVTATGGRVRVDGSVSGDADLSARRLEIGPGARIDGNLVHRAEAVEIHPDAEITGTVTALDYDERLTRRDLLYRLIGVGLLAAVAFLLGGIVLSLVLAGVLPRLMEATNATLHRRAVPSLGVGVVWAVGAPLAVLLFMVLVIGIPLGLFLLGVFLLTIPLAGAVVAHFVGRELRGLRQRPAAAPGTGGRVAWTLLGAVILMLLTFIPFLGMAISVLIFLLGSGAAVLVFLAGDGGEEAAESAG